MSERCNFVVGQKVAPTCDLSSIRKGQVVTIAKIELATYEAVDGIGELVCLNFVGVTPAPGFYGFDARWFRPVNDRKTDITIFRAMLSPAKQPEQA